MLLKLTLEILTWKSRRIIQNVVKVLEQDISVILPALAGRHDIGLVENGKEVIQMKTLLSFIFVFGVLMTLGCMDGQPISCSICTGDCPCIDGDCICANDCTCPDCA